MIIDFHTHLLDAGFWPDEWWDAVALEWASAAPDRQPTDIRPRIEAGLIDPDGSRMIAEMDRAGVDQAVVLPMDWGPDYHSHVAAEAVIQHAIDTARRFPGRVIPFAGIDPRRPGAAELIDRFIAAGDVAGLKLYPSAGWHPMHDAAQPLYGACAAAGLPVLFHTGDPLPILSRELGDPAGIAAVATAFPTLQIVLGHAGAPDRWAQALKVAEQHDQVYLEFSAWIWAHDVCDEGRDALANRLLEAKQRIGMSRLLFGTDHVSGRRVRGDGAMQALVEVFRGLPARLAQDEITESDLDLLLGGNAAVVLRVWLEGRR